MEITDEYAFEQFVSDPEKLNEEGMAVTIARIIKSIISKTQETTLQGLMRMLTTNVKILLIKLENHPVMDQRTTLTIKSICEIIVHYMSKRLRKIESKDLTAIKEKLLALGDALIDNFKKSKAKLANFASNIIKDGDTILTIGTSSLLQYIFLDSAERGKRFTVIITETRPCCDGYKIFDKLRDNHIDCIMITDNQIGFSLEKADYVLVSAEAVTENGGIINRVGTYTAALCAMALKKPFYVAAENYKFSRIFALNQDDLPETTKTVGKFDYLREISRKDEIEEQEIQLCDFTPPECIKLLITDTGILTPSAISDELIQMFNI